MLKCLSFVNCKLWNSKWVNKCYFSPQKSPGLVKGKIIEFFIKVLVKEGGHI